MHSLSIGFYNNMGRFVHYTYVDRMKKEELESYISFMSSKGYRYVGYCRSGADKFRLKFEI